MRYKQQCKCFNLLPSNPIFVPQSLLICKKILPLQTTNKNAETTINVIVRARARIALDSYW